MTFCIVAKVVKNKRGIYNMAMLPIINLLETFVVFLQIVGIFSFFLLCILATRENQTRFRFEWLSLSTFFLMIHYFCRFLLSNNFNFLIVVLVHPVTLIISFLAFIVFLLTSSQGKIEKNLMGGVVVFFVLITVVLFRFYPPEIFLWYFELIFPLFALISFHLLCNWSLRTQNDKRDLILLWCWLIKLFFLVSLGINLLSYGSLPINELLRKQLVFYGNLLWLVIIFAMNESFWMLIKWIRGINAIPYEKMYKVLHVALIFIGFIGIYFWGHKVSLSVFLLMYVFLNKPIMFALYQMLQVQNCKKLFHQELTIYQNVIHFNPHPSGILNNKGELMGINSASEILFGKSESELKGMIFSELISHTDDPAWLVTLLKTTNQKKQAQFSMIIPRLDQAKKHDMKVTLYPIASETNDENNHYLFWMSDETESKKVVISKDQMIGLVSHELRTPLTVISESIQLLKKQCPNQEENKMTTQVIDIASRNITKMTDLINQILSLEKIKSGKFPYHFEKNNLHHLLQIVISDFQFIAQNKKISLELKLESRKEEIIFDEGSITEVMSILIRNAIDYTSQGNIIIGTYATSSEINVFVQDTGTGIKEEDLKRVFEPFNPGLGLFICKTILEDHGGQIFVESKWGKGSRFTISLPG